MNNRDTNAGIVTQLETHEGPRVERDAVYSCDPGFQMQPNMIDPFRIIVLLDFKANRCTGQSNEFPASWENGHGLSSSGMR